MKVYCPLCGNLLEKRETTVYFKTCIMIVCNTCTQHATCDYPESNSVVNEAMAYRTYLNYIAAYIVNAAI